MADSSTSTSTSVSVIAITVELPQLARTFSVAVSPGATIRDVKDAVAQTCEGRPRTDGQRLIAKGRVLRDEERVGELWAAADAHVVHLAVSPWAWTVGRPESPVSRPSNDATNTSIDTSDSSGNTSSTTSTTSTSSTSTSTSTSTSANTAATLTAPSVSRTVEFSQALRTALTTHPVETVVDMLNTSRERGAHADPPPYIMHLHHRALRALSAATPAPARPLSDSAEAREAARAAVTQAGMAWPEILDAEYPEPGEPGEGVTYEFTMVAGLPYLQNLTPYAKPTARQAHALKVLAYTFPLLSCIRANALTEFLNTLRQTRPQGREQLQRDGGNGRRGIGFGLGLGLGAGAGGGAPGRFGFNFNAGRGPGPNANANANPNANANANANGNANGFHAQLQIRIPVRALLTSLVLLAFRVLLLMYFFSPARKPLFSLLVGVWVLYEAWGVVRGAFEEAGGVGRVRMDEVDAAVGAAVAQAQGAEGVNAPNANLDANANLGNAQQQQRQQHRRPNGNGVPHAQQPNLTPDYILTRLARLNLSDDDDFLEPPPARNGQGAADLLREPGWFFKARLFVTLFILTLHPAFWNRRRILLRMREARVRAEAGAREVLVEVEREEGEMRRVREEERQRQRRVGEGQDGAGEDEEGEEESRPLTTQERSLRAKREAYEKMAEIDARRPAWVRQYVDRVLREPWADQ